jgi:hypothetical protein
MIRPYSASPKGSGAQVSEDEDKDKDVEIGNFSSFQIGEARNSCQDATRWFDRQACSAELH